MSTMCRCPTNFVELSPSWETANCAATQECPRILWNSKVHCRVHKSPPLVPILSHIDSVHPTPSYLFKIQFNIIHSPTPWSSSWSFSIWSSQQYHICIPPLPHSCYMTWPSHPPWLQYSNFILWTVQVMNLLLMQIRIQVDGKCSNHCALNRYVT
jgi:hypothetical protein